MGNTSSMIIFMSAFSLMSIIMSLSIYAVDPCAPELFGNYVYNNVVSSRMSLGSSYTCVNDNSVRYSSLGFSNNMTSLMPERGTTGSLNSVASSGLTIFPDWLFSSFQWLTGIGVFVLNIIGAPYTVCLSLLPTFMSSFASAIGSFFSILFLWFFINWITGKDN